MMCKRVVTKDASDEEEDILEQRYPKVSRKKKYFDLIERVSGEQVMKEEFEAHPIIRKSIASTKLAELTSSYTQYYPEKFPDVSEEDVDVEKCPWHLDIVPTQIEEILDSWILERFAEENMEKIPLKRKERVKLLIRNFFQRYFRVKGIKKKIKDEVIEPEKDPRREFQELNRKFIEERVLCIDQSVEEMSDIPFNESMIHAHDLSSKPSMSELVPEIKATRSASVETSAQSKQNSEFSIEQQHNISSDTEDLFSEGSTDFEQRFKIGTILSDFSLQQQTLFSDKHYL